MSFRKASEEDMDRVREILDGARKYMAAEGNETQWGEQYPIMELAQRDMENGNMYVEEIDGQVEGLFVLVIGDEPNYEHIDGSWKDDSTYGTLHRVASSGKYGGFFNRALQFALTKTGHIRIDTHKNNITMRRLIESNFFQYCGIIMVEDGSPRLAYELY